MTFNQSLIHTTGTLRYVRVLSMATGNTDSDVVRQLRYQRTHFYGQWRLLLNQIHGVDIQGRETPISQVPVNVGWNALNLEGFVHGGLRLRTVTLRGCRPCESNSLSSINIDSNEFDFDVQLDVLAISSR
jgi:hypothetical protein